ncbi:periplasmic binding protein-like II [Anaeromyces robustus]|uniref:Periplasmic binding protein-like II n=1 Tax=Anaeromyces robustus TaxID=1754192 RepID=A0A1Y1XBA0_9FUNG|nr:periplasmic binding protein-like II [Anaeromyces robustus]|eukprot:ORX82997.1 periplasmic binding protein-like II [Anaeromyces robustus]
MSSFLFLYELNNDVFTTSIRTYTVITTFLNYNLKSYKCAKINLKIVAFYYEGDLEIFELMKNDFNKYSEENNLDIEVSYVYYSSENCTIYTADYGSTIEHILKKKSEKYDIYYYDVMYSPRYSQYFIDIKDYIPEHIKLYSPGIASDICTYNGKWVGLSLNIKYSVLYYNTKLFEKYDINIPQTWDDFLEIGKYILKKEKEDGNNNLIGYNGLFPDSESELISAIEFIHSFRNSIDSPTPEYDSKEAINALNKIKQIKDELESNEAFQSGEYGAVMNLLTENAIFLKWWYYYNLNDEGYSKIPIVGNYEGVSASGIGGMNAGISKYISKENIDASIEFLKFITSKEFQKKLLINKISFSSMTSLYDDDEVCQVVDCEIFKKMQFIPRPSVVDYDEYSFNFRNYLKKFLYGNETAEDTLNNIIDITKIYYISINPNQSSSIGLYSFIITIVIAVLIILFSIFIFMEKYKGLFDYISKDLWIIFFIGLLINLSYIFTEYGEVTNIKCKLKPLLLSIGCNLTFTPFLYKLIVNFQERNKYFDYIEKNKYLFIFFINTLDVFLNLIFFISPFTPQYKNSLNGKKYKYCGINNSLSIYILSVLVIEKIILLLVILFFIFIEWNIIKTNRDVKLLTSAIYIDIILYILFVTFKFISIENYIVYSGIRIVVIMLYVLSNFLFIYFFRIFFILTKKEETIKLYINKIHTIDVTTSNYNNENTSFNNTSTINSCYSTNKRMSFSKIMNYHNSTKGKDSWASGLNTLPSNQNQVINSNITS